MSSAKGFYGISCMFLALLRQAKAVVIHGDRFARRDECTPDQLLGLCGMAGLVFDNTEKVQGIGVMRIAGKNLTVDHFGRTKLSSLVVLKGRREGLGDGGGFGGGHRNAEDGVMRRQVYQNQES